MVRGDEYYMAICNKTGCIAVYNSSLNLFVSPFADGPLQFTTTLDGKMNVKNMSRFGRSFSIVRVPYSLKLLIHELQAMNVQMRIITEDNIDQLMNMSFSNNIQLLLDDDREISKVIESYKKKNATILKTDDDRQAGRLPVPVEKTTPSFDSAASPAYVPTSPAYQPNSPQYNPNSPQYDPNSPVYSARSPQYHPDTPSSEKEGQGGLNSPQYSPHSPEEEAPRFIPSSPSGTPPPDEEAQSVTPYKPITFEPRSPEISPIRDTFNAETPVSRMNIKDEKVKAEFDALPERDQRLLMKMINKKKEDLKQEAEANMESPTAILNLEEEKKEEEKKEGDEKEGSSGGSIKKIVTFS